jgi:hypothetical protein
MAVRKWSEVPGKAPAGPFCGEIDVVRKLVVAGAFAAFGFAVAGPLQHLGVLPETALGNASKAAIKSALNIGVQDVWACGGGGGQRGNNGWGNGEDFAPGNSLANQPKFEDPNTGPSPSNSPRSGGGDR